MLPLLPPPLLLLLLLLLLWGMKEGEVGAESMESYSLDMEGKVVVQEGLCVLVPCKFSYPKEEWTDSDPVHGYWFRDGAKIKQDPPVATNNQRRPTQNGTRSRFSLLGKPLKNNCSLEIRETRKDDAGLYFFRIERGKARFNYIRNKMTLEVTDLTNTPNILIPETMEAGRPSNLTCSAPWACGSPTFSWTGSSASLLSPNTTGSSVLTVTPQPWDHGANLTCQVTLPGAGVTTRRTIRLNVSYAPKSLTVTISQGADSESITPENGSSFPISEGQSLRLLCSTDSYPPANLSWTLDNLSLWPSKLSKPGLLELFPVHRKHEGVYTCQAQHALGSQHFSLSLRLQRKSGLMAEVVLVAVVEAAVKVLLVGLCLIILRVRSRGRRQQGQQSTGQFSHDHQSASLRHDHQSASLRHDHQSASRTLPSE